jgi:hypothetical protein
MTHMAEQNAEPEIICANRDCQIRETKKCVEGFDTAECPHFGHPPIDIEVLEQPVSETSDGIRLPSANTMDLLAAARDLRARDGRVIAIVGPSDAGKTSLIASLYDLFQEGPIGGAAFGASKTLHALENTCHDARAASRRGIPHINRTPIGEVRFYHIDLYTGAPDGELSLLLGDRAGEEYRSAEDDASVVDGFYEIKRADSLTMLVDGERLLDSGARHNLRSQVLMMLQAFVDGDAVHHGQRLAVVLTKIDLLQTSPNRVRAERDFAELVSQISKLFEPNFATIEAFKIAASPKTDDLGRGTGIGDLLSFWMCPAGVASTTLPPKPTSTRVFAQLGPLA